MKFTSADTCVIKCYAGSFIEIYVQMLMHVRDEGVLNRKEP